jgi:hypothetical protein
VFSRKDNVVTKDEKILTDRISASNGADETKKNQGLKLKGETITHRRKLLE